jgi:dTDP-4-amino-4,6-dideoxygalactose transaminase
MRLFAARSSEMTRGSEVSDLARRSSGILSPVTGQRVSSTVVSVPFLDLGPVHRELKEQILEDVAELVDRGDFTNGEAVRTFEEAYAAFCGTRRCVGLASGLDALRLALLAAGLQPGDEVVVPALTFAATFEAVTQVGGTPLVVDVSEDDYNLDMGAVEAVLSERTRFLLPVHLYGQMADIRLLHLLAERRGVTIVEDACQAHGAERDGVCAGAAGLAAAFSFYPAKNLGAIGDAGALVTNDEVVADIVLALREHGQTAKYEHELEGYTARLDTIQALVLLRKLPLLEGWNAERRAAARFYSEALDGIGDLKLPPVPAGSRPVWHLYVVRTAEPERLGSFLRERGIATARHYPTPPHLSCAFAWLGHAPGSFPVAEAIARECLSLPIFPGIAEEQLAAVAWGIAEYFERG